jgi:lysophospholipase L1-like esterase
MAALSRSARLGWIHKPNTDYLYERDDFRVLVHYSSMGLRDREYSLEKPPGTFRIAMLGDSFVEASQVHADSAMSERLEADLGAAPPDGRRYEVINFGVSGYGTCQQLLLLEELALRFRPDLVISACYFNDLDDDARFGLCDLDSAGRLQVRPEAKLSRAVRWRSAIKSHLYQHSHLWMFLSTRTLRHGGGAATVTYSAAGGPPVHGCPGRHASLESRLSLREAPPDAARAVQLHAAIWEAMESRCRTSGARFVGVIGVAKPQLEPGVFLEALAANGCRPEAHDAALPPGRLRAAAAARGLDVVDLLPYFRAASTREPLHFRTDGHWNAAGHRIAAAALRAELQERGALERTH